MSELPCLSCGNDWSCANCPGVNRGFRMRTPLYKVPQQQLLLTWTLSSVQFVSGSNSKDLPVDALLIGAGLTVATPTSGIP